MRKMQSAAAAVVLVILPGYLALAQNAQSTSPPPPWAFTLNTERTPRPPDDGTLHRVPGSSVALTLTQVRDGFNVPDWRPNDHPPAPDVVAHGRRPDVRACGYCHYLNGKGKPENASLAGLPAAYIIQQVADIRDGLRKSSEPRMVPPAMMVTVAKAANDEEVEIAAEYFAAIEWTPWVRVVESATVSKTRISAGLHLPIEGTEPLGQRIIEMPEHPEQTELRDSSAPFVAYVPIGSIDKGEALVAEGQCRICHGPDLKGLGPIPGLAGRSPQYAFRQLFDIQQGNRNGLWADLMKPVVANLSVDDMIAVAAYTASRVP